MYEYDTLLNTCSSLWVSGVRSLWYYVNALTKSSPPPTPTPPAVPLVETDLPYLGKEPQSHTVRGEG